MIIEVVPAEKTQKSVLRQLMELYNYDFSEYTNEDVDEHGLYGYSYLDHFWTEEARYPFFIKVDSCFAGFVLVGTFCRYTNNKAYSIAEFFVLKKYRKMNIGKTAAKHVFDLFKGEWEVRVLHANKPALPFWHKVINEYTNGSFTLHSMPISDWDGIGYTFNNK
ncbi:MAG: GNAT family N-acetyltransferase [Defluviitaleaceae bacterium]|nr:GNAT family N-acetyltransferase [Defluviitaleaceae bacterium]